MGLLGYREAAEFWGVAADPELSFRLHALVGGAADYKGLCGGAGPRSRADLDRWVRLRLLDPAGPMFRAGGLPLPPSGGTVTDAAWRASALAAISAGAAWPAQIAAALGQAGSVARLLAELRDLGLIELLADPLNGVRSAAVIVKPIARFHALVIGPHEADLAAGLPGLVWAASQEVVAAQIYRPHFASLARQWCLRHAATATLGGVARGARPTAVACGEHGQEHELAAVVVEEPVGSGRTLAIGETSATDAPVEAAQLRRLEHLRGLLPGGRVGSPTRLLLFSRTGFAAGLAEEAADRADVELVGLERLYRGA